MSAIALLPVTTLTGLILLLLIPSSTAARRVTPLRRAVCGLAGLHAVVSAVLLVALGWTGQALVVRPDVFGTWQAAPPLLLDGTSVVMLTLVAAVGWVICRFSVRYLDGDPGQGPFFRWTAVTLGAVSLLVVSGHLILTCAAWLLSGFGMHQLLLHHPGRPGARRAASTKFLFSRLGDAALLLAAALLYAEFGTFELTALFSASAGVHASSLSSTSLLPLSGGLLILCAILKSAQFPFHAWLPETMEAPTPVSALMHAGIVNAGGYLLIRTAPLLSLSDAAMFALTVVGGVTAVLGALAMLTQSAVKRSLAFSTVSQMGFMMLQCGLGAFSAALLHLVAHSMYKAWAFLNSGDILREPALRHAPSLAAGMRRHAGVVFGASVLLTLFSVTSVSALLHISPTAKPGGWILGLILCLGFSRWIFQFARRDGVVGLFLGTLLSVPLFGLCLGGYVVIDHLMALPAWLLPAWTIPSSLFVAAIFGFLLTTEFCLAIGRRFRWLDALQVHASRGFYIDAAWRRLATSLNA